MTDVPAARRWPEVGWPAWLAGITVLGATLRLIWLAAIPPGREDTDGYRQASAAMRSALLNLAERLHAGKLRLPDARTTGDPSSSWWRRLLPAGASIRPNNVMPRSQRLRFATNDSQRRQAW